MRVVFSTTIITERCNKNLANRALHNRTPLPIARLVWRPNKSVYGIGKTGEARNIQAESDTQFCLRDVPLGQGRIRSDVEDQLHGQMSTFFSLKF